MSDPFQETLHRLAAGDTLSENEAAAAFAQLIAGEISAVRMAAFLAALSVRRATQRELAGAAKAMRQAMRKIEGPATAIDMCGTGGDGHGTLNVSTAAAFVVAAAGVPVAKHGNRNMSSRTGAADVLEALGVRIDLEPPLAERCLSEAGICFLFAQTYHPAMKHVAPVRKELGFRTVFNLLGPLSNPAGVKRQLLGVYAKEWLLPVAEVLSRLGAESAWIVHGSDGLDELTITGASDIAKLKDGHIEATRVAPEDVGLERAPLSAIKGGVPEDNADAIRKLFGGAKGPFRDIVLLNAGAALVVAEKVNDLKSGIALAAQCIDSGAAAATLARLERVSRGLGA